MKRVTPSLRNASFVRMSAIVIGLTAIVPGCADTAKEAITASTADYVLTNDKDSTSRPSPVVLTMRPW